MTTGGTTMARGSNGRHDDGDWRHDDGRHDDGRHDDGKGQKEAAAPPPPARHRCRQTKLIVV
jgi:hypothetical protein